jgi:hypothetical protein
MDSEQKARVRLLVDALRSGEYAQGRGALCLVYTSADYVEERRYCCLGVACEVAKAYGAVRELRVNFNRSVVYGTGAHESANYLPGPVREWFGFETIDPVVDGSRLSDWNDRAEEDFNGIADRIERQWLSDDTSV